MKNGLLRQGDVLLRRVKEIPVEARIEEGDRCILAYGEVTGHSHEVLEHGRLWVDVTDKGRRYLEILADTTLDHEEHGHIALTKGTYEIVRQREYIPGAVRTVVD